MHSIDAKADDRVIALCDGLDTHAAAGAVLSGAVAGDVYVDDPARPRSALVRVKHRFYLAGAADNVGFNADMGAWFGERVYPEALREGTIEGMMAARCPIRDMRECYEFEALPKGAPIRLPEGIALRPVDRALLAEAGLKGLDALREEMRSERPSVEAFLDSGHGMCAIHGREIVSWCLSEYDHGHRCEIGIETAPGYRRQGLATATASALVERLLARGVARIGWHCWRSNVASGATARRVGFERAAEYPVYFAWFDEAANLAVNGNIRLRRGDPVAALTWFARSMAREDAPSWAWFGAARAAAALGRVEEALDHLGSAVDRGFMHAGAIREAEEFRVLHDSDRWRRLLARLAAEGAEG